VEPPTLFDLLLMLWTAAKNAICGCFDPRKVLRQKANQTYRNLTTHRASRLREHVVGLGANQPDGADHDD
jgi:hypothetical protein